MTKLIRKFKHLSARLRNDKKYFAFALLESLIGLFVASVASIIMLSITIRTYQSILEFELHDKIVENTISHGNLLERTIDSENKLDFDATNSLPILPEHLNRCFPIKQSDGAIEVVKNVQSDIESDFVSTCSVEATTNRENFPECYNERHQSNEEIYTMLCLTDIAVDPTFSNKYYSGFVIGIDPLCAKSGNERLCRQATYKYPFIKNII